MNLRGLASTLLGALALFVLAAPAQAAIPRSLADPASCAEHTAGPLDYWLCDDGVPATGGTDANEGGAKAITVPARYRGWRKLPPKAAGATEVPGADRNGNVALDVNVSLPRSAPPRGGYPLLFFMHGCCGGDKTGWQADEIDAEGQRWHYSNAWFASRGYAVVTYTARGFVDGSGNGSTGQTELDSRSYEINDYQHLACQLTGAARRFSRATGERVRINPRRVVTTGGSYGAGFSWLTVTDPRWRCGAGTGARGEKMHLAASAPMYGWTDLLYALVPTGHHSQDPRDLPRLDGCDSGPIGLDRKPCPPAATTPLGMPKTSIVAGLYASGEVGIGAAAPHTTFPPKIRSSLACLNGPYPPVPGPLCERPIASTLPEFLRERSAYYQHPYFRKIKRKRSWRVPVFSAATFTDPLFTSIEHNRMENRLREAAPGYPIQTYHGDYQHFVQNKDKEWGDLCGADHHVCANADYRRGKGTPRAFNRRPRGLRRTGITSRLNRFVDHFARPRANRRQRRPRFDSTVSLQICPQNATGRYPADEPGPRYRARRFARQARRTMRVPLEGGGATTSLAPNPHALLADPVANQQANGGACARAEGSAGAGVVQLRSAPLGRSAVMIGSTELTVEFTGLGDASALGLQLNARMYDVAPGGATALVDRGVYRLTSTESPVSFELHGNGWRFRPGHRILVELAQDDQPFVKAATVPSALTIDRARLAIPVR